MTILQNWLSPTSLPSSFPLVRCVTMLQRGRSIRVSPPARVSMWCWKVLASVLCSQPCASWSGEEEEGKQMLVGAAKSPVLHLHTHISHHITSHCPLATVTRNQEAPPPPFVGQLTQLTQLLFCCRDILFLYLILRWRYEI